MKKIEKKIKNSIKVDDLIFFDCLPKISHKKSILIPIFSVVVTILIIFVLNIIPLSNSNTLYEDNIIINLLDNFDMELNYNIADKIKNEYLYKPDKVNVSILDINREYIKNFKETNIKNQYHLKLSNEIIQTNIEYKIDDKEVIVAISKNNPVIHYGMCSETTLFSLLMEKETSIVGDKKVVLARDIDNNYYAALSNEELNILIYSNLEEEKFIEFLKDNIL